TDGRGPGFVRTVNGAVDIGAYETQPHLGITAAPPDSIAPGTPFGMTVTVSDPFGQVVAGFSGIVTVALVAPGGAKLRGTLSVAARNGVATFAGLSIDHPGTYRITASVDPAITAFTTSVTVAVPPGGGTRPPTIVAEKVLFAGKGRRRHA